MDGRYLSVQDGYDGTRVPALLDEGKDENGVARVPLVDSLLHAEVVMNLTSYGKRFCNENQSQVSPDFQIARCSSNFVNNTGPSWGKLLSAPTDLTGVIVKSSSVNDSASGTGLQSFDLTYLGIDNKEYTVSVALNGTSTVTVATVPSINVATKLMPTAFGSLGAAAGTVVISSPDDPTFADPYLRGGLVYGATSDPNNFLYMIYFDQNKTFYVTQTNPSGNGNGGFNLAQYNDGVTPPLSSADTHPPYYNLEIESLVNRTSNTTQTYSVVHDPPISLVPPSFNVPTGTYGMIWTNSGARGFALNQ